MLLGVNFWLKWIICVNDSVRDRSEIPLHPHPLRITGMSYNVEEAVEDWVLSLSRSEIDSYLSRMVLK